MHSGFKVQQSHCPIIHFLNIFALYLVKILLHSLLASDVEAKQGNSSPNLFFSLPPLSFLFIFAQFVPFVPFFYSCSTRWRWDLKAQPEEIFLGIFLPLAMSPCKEQLRSALSLQRQCREFLMTRCNDLGRGKNQHGSLSSPPQRHNATLGAKKWFAPPFRNCRVTKVNWGS